DLLDALVRTVENDLDAAVLHAGLGEQIAQSYAAPARIPDQTVKDVRIVSAAFETGVDLDLLAALQLRQRHFDRPLDHPGDAQPIRVLGDLGLVVVMNDVEIANRRVEGFDMARVE